MDAKSPNQGMDGPSDQQNQALDELQQLAQAASSAAEPIGQVERTQGTVIATRADGTRVELRAGDPVYRGDELATGESGGVGIVLADNSVFSLGQSGKMVLDEMVYDPGGTEGEAVISLVTGAATFVSGQIAKFSQDAMVVRTPVATIGIRGTKVFLETDGESIQAVNLPENTLRGETVGEIVLMSPSGEMLGTVNTYGGGWQWTPSVSATPSSFQMDASQIQNIIQQVGTILPRTLEEKALDVMDRLQRIRAEAKEARESGEEDKAERLEEEAEDLAEKLETALEDVEKNLGYEVNISEEADLGLEDGLGDFETAGGGNDPLGDGDGGTGGRTGLDIIRSQEVTEDGGPSVTVANEEDQAEEIEEVAEEATVVVAPEDPSSDDASQGDEVSPGGDGEETGDGGLGDDEETGDGEAGGGASPLTGHVVDGYMANMRVFADNDGDGIWDDVNGNGIYDAEDGDEQMDITGTDGAYTLAAGSTGDIIAVALNGAYDTATGLDFTGTLTAPPGASVVTPLTTLVDAYMDANPGMSSSVAAATVASNFDLGGVDILNVDPHGNLSLMAKTSMIMNTMVQLQAASGGSFESGFAALAGLGPVDLTNETDLGALLGAAGVPDSGGGDLAALMATGNGLVAGAGSLEQIAQMGAFLQGDLAGDISAARGGQGFGALQGRGDFLAEEAALRGTPADQVLVGDLQGMGTVDVINGRGGNDDISGLGGNDQLFGGAGNDILRGGAGSDLLNGGDGNDLAIFDGSFSDYSFTYSNGTLTVADISENGVDTVIDVETVRFNEGDFAVGSFAGGLIQGTSGNDELFGTAGSDDIQGLGGFDIIHSSPGDDVMHGGSGDNLLDFSNDPNGVSVNLVSGSATDGWGNHDAVNHFKWVYGSAYDDTILGTDLTGGANGDILSGGAGNDILNGRAGNWDQVYYSDDGGIGVSVNLATGIAIDEFGGTDSLSNFEVIGGTSYDDTLTGDSNNNLIYAYQGTDIVDGGGGIDTIDYQWDDTPGGVSIDLENGFAIDAGGATDTLISIESAVGSQDDDSLTGNSDNNQLQGKGGDDDLQGNAGDDILKGGAGNDTLDGGTGFDTAVFSGSVSDYSVWADDQGIYHVTDTVGSDGVDIVTGVEQFQFGLDTMLASELDLVIEGDGTIIGTSNSETLLGGAGDDVLIGLGGDDHLDGGAGNDTADYSAANDSVHADLGAGTADNGDDGFDTLANIENLTGTSFNDVLVGDGNDNIIEGGLGTDTIIGGAGFDTLVTGAETMLDLSAARLGGEISQIEMVDLDQTAGATVSLTSPGDVAAATGSPSGTLIIQGGADDQVVLGQGGDANDWTLTGQVTLSGRDFNVYEAVNGAYTVTLKVETAIQQSGLDAAPTILGVEIDAQTYATTVTMDEDGSLSGQIGAIDNTADPTLTFSGGQGDNGPFNGTVTLNSDGSFNYIPNENFFGQDFFTVTVTDDTGNSDTEVITIDVAEVIDNPVVGSPLSTTRLEDSGSYDIDLLNGSSDPDGGTLSVANVATTGDASGLSIIGSLLTIDADAYQSLGDGDQEVITVNYDIEDGQGGSTPQTATVTIIGSNDAPTIDYAIDGMETEDTGPRTYDLTDGVSDLEGDTLTVDGGSVVLNSGNDVGATMVGNLLTIDTDLYDYLGDSEVETLSFTYDVLDGNGGVVSQSAIIEIYGTNDLPEVTINTGTTYVPGTDVTVTAAMLNAADADHGAADLTYTLNSAPEGDLMLDGVALAFGESFTQADIEAGLLTYNSEFGIDDSFIVTVSDPDLGTSSSATFALTAIGLTLTGTSGPDDLSGSNADDVITGLGGNDALEGLDGADQMDGGADDDALYGGAGADTMTGGTGDDYLMGDEGNDVMDGGTGIDTLAIASDTGSGGSVTLAEDGTWGYGNFTDGWGQSNDIKDFENVEGSDYVDAITGNSGDNVLIGMGGNDVLRGGAGNDTLIGDSRDFGLQESMIQASDGINLNISGVVDVPDRFGGLGAPGLIDADGARFIASAAFDDVGSDTDAGQAFIYSFDGTQWVQEAALTAPNLGLGNVHHQFGSSVSINGDWAVVGEQQHGNFLNNEWYGTYRQGAAHVYHYENGSWNLATSLQASSPETPSYEDIFGSSVAIDSDAAAGGQPRVVVGAGGDGTGFWSGQAYVYDFDGTNWNQSILVNPQVSSNDYFGGYVEVDGDTVVVSNFGNHGGQGEAYVFELSGGTWSETARLHDMIPAGSRVSSDEFGEALAIEGDLLVTSSRDASGGGAVYVFERVGGSWQYSGEITASDTDGSDQFGFDVSISNGVVVVTAPGNETESGVANGGTVYMFENQGGTWVETNRVERDAADGGDGFGQSMAYAEGQLVVGAGYVDSQQGAVFAYTESTPVAGNDLLYGDEGTDTAVFSGNRADYVISATHGTYTVSGTNGTDYINGVEVFEFADGSMSSYLAGQTIWGDSDFGSAGDDSMNGSGAASSLSGLAGDDVIFGYSGSDVLVGDGSLDFGFDADAEGWVSTDGQSSPVLYMGSGGADGGGYLKIVDTGTSTPQFLAPVALSGDLGGFLGGQLTFAMKSDLNDGGQPVVTIVSTAGTLTLSIASPAAAWTTYDLTLDDLEGWVLDGDHPATQDEIAAVLADVTEVRFSSDFVYGNETVGLDSVSLVSADGNDVLNGGTGNDILYGNGGADTLTGHSGVDQLYGGDGDDVFAVTSSIESGDVFDGGAGHDVLRNDMGQTMWAAGFSATDVEEIDGGSQSFSGDGAGNTLDFSGITTWTNVAGIYGNGGADLIIGSDAADPVIDGGVGNDTIFGNGGADTLTGYSGYDTLYGGAGNDVFAVTANIEIGDVFDGGADHDILRNDTGTTLYMAGFAPTGVEEIDGNFQALSGDGAANTLDFSGITTWTNVTAIYGDGGADIIYGSDFADPLINGGVGNDTIYGNGGSDTLTGYSGYDTLYGGDGDDVFAVTANIEVGDVFDGGSDTDILRNDTGTTLYMARFAPTGVEKIDGSCFALSGDGAANTLDFSGMTTWTNVTGIYGDGGADIIYGSDFADPLINGGVGNDTIYGNDGSDIFFGSPGYDSLYGADRDDVFAVTANIEAGDVFDGGLGTDTLRNDTGTTLYMAHFAPTSVETIDGSGFALSGDAGANTLDFSGVTTWTNVAGIYGDGGADIIYGSDFADPLINGGVGSDTIYGNDGADTLTGYTGYDSLYGGDGDDVFAVTANIEAGDVFDGGLGTDTLRNDTGTTLYMAHFAPTSVETIDGSGFALSGDAGANTLDFSGVTTWAGVAEK
ncbi:Ig-like domain-containing protein [Magnetospira sp. QH-2]|uniref:Ig-like domain-containing protein n=1 Tax=Magnetospira sp. (strain QH-2) TaxID=1288970 RepID=UPI0003E80F15|nr:cadherin-like domain-containing protein [Magnetospira sp. QH-2]CCQ74846.1 protein of unknown function [Magnetospira sp. QH-2]